jgi:hypothetical protein
MQLKQLIFLLCIAFPGIYVQAQPQLSKDQLAVQQAVVKLFMSLSDKDSVAMKAGCTADVVFYEYGNAWNMDSLILKAVTLNRAPDFKRTNQFEFLNTTIKGKTAWTSYNLQSEVLQNGKRSTTNWSETVIAVKEKKVWKVKVLHSTLIKRS